MCSAHCPCSGLLPKHKEDLLFCRNFGAFSLLLDWTTVKRQRENVGREEVWHQKCFWLESNKQHGGMHWSHSATKNLHKYFYFRHSHLLLFCKGKILNAGVFLHSCIGTLRSESFHCCAWCNVQYDGSLPTHLFPSNF